MKKSITAILAAVLALSILLTACSKGGDNSTGGNSTGGTKAATHPKQDDPDAIPGANGMGEYGGNLSNTTDLYTHYPFTHGAGWIFYAPDRYSLYKISADGKSGKKMDLSALMTEKIKWDGDHPLFNNTFKFYDGKVMFTDYYISADAKEAGSFHFGDSYGYVGSYTIGEYGFYIGEIDPNDPNGDNEDSASAKKHPYLMRELSKNNPKYKSDRSLNKDYVKPTMVKKLDRNGTLMHIDKTHIYYKGDDGFCYRIKHDGASDTKIFKIPEKESGTNGLTSPYMNFVGDYIYYKENRTLMRVKTNGTGQPEIIISDFGGMLSLNSAGDYLYFTTTTYFSGESPFYSERPYIGKLKISDAVPGKTAEELFEKTERFEPNISGMGGYGQFDRLYILGDWIFYNDIYTHNGIGYTVFKMIKTDFTGFTDVHELLGIKPEDIK